MSRCWLESCGKRTSFGQWFCDDCIAQANAEVKCLDCISSVELIVHDDIKTLGIVLNHSDTCQHGTGAPAMWIV